MEKTDNNPGKFFFILASSLLFLGLLGGILASISYIQPDFLKNSLGFTALRPLHASSVMFWIMIGASACVYSGLYLLVGLDSRTILLAKIQLALWIIAIIGIYGSYFTGNFGGREYWEFNPIFALPILGTWGILLYNFIRTVRTLRQWPVYVWMWLTGIVFFIFIFLENYLWIFPYFRSHFISDMTIQWKVNGSIVGALNQILYGTSFYLMDRLATHEHQKVGFKKLTFIMYFLGLTNLMFNWGHHIYTLPTESYILYISYIVSMSEWIIFLRIINNWRNQMEDISEYYKFFPYRFLMASEFWVFVNLGQALLMSIPAINLYTHGTHVTVAHAMGTTIGINTMILFAAMFMYFSNKEDYKKNRTLNSSFWVLQIGLFIMVLSLDVSGIIKGFWQLSADQSSFSDMMEGLRPWFIVLVISGISIATSIAVILIYAVKMLLKK